MILYPAVAVAALLIALRGMVRPFWNCSSVGEVISRVMYLSELEWLGLLFFGVLACLAVEEICRASQISRRRH